MFSISKKAKETAREAFSLWGFLIGAFFTAWVIYLTILAFINGGRVTSDYTVYGELWWEIWLVPIGGGLAIISLFYSFWKVAKGEKN